MNGAASRGPFLLQTGAGRPRGEEDAQEHFGDRLLEAMESKRSHVVVGLDPDYDSLPAEMPARIAQDSHGSDEPR